MTDNSNEQYRPTLNLPKTDFAMKANLPSREPEMIKFWQSIDLYKEQRRLFAGRPKFVLHDGPPYANGNLHLGHAVNKILKDIIIKSRGQLGFDAPYVPGWDCHGLPIELVVEKKFGKVGDKIDAATFRTKCREFALTQVDLQRKGFIRFGVLGDWENPYLTLNPQSEADIVRSLAKIFKNGHIERGLRPVHWCLDCQSSLAEAEVEYDREHVSMSIDVKFALVDHEALSARLGQALAGNGDISVVIWTTTPWTLPGNEAVSVNANFDYVLVQADNERYIVAKDLYPALAERWKQTFEVLHEFKGEALKLLNVEHPLYANKIVPVIVGDHVTLDAGTGCVHTAPAHGEDDWNMGLLYQLPVNNPVLGSGVYAKNVERYAGQHIHKIAPIIIEDLKTSNKLLLAEKMTHSYPLCWRHKTPTIFRATPQWFISMDQQALRKNILSEIDKVAFTPDWGKARLELMIANRGDWCISRQRSWGVPIPLFLHKETGALHPNTKALMEQVADCIEKEGLESWFSSEVSDFLGEEAGDYEKNQDILDVWFDSGTTHASVLARRSELTFPADLYLEGSDQHRGWFNSSITSSVAIHNKAPYKGLLTHGFTVDGQGRKMSKSLNNGVDPQDVMNKMGADVLRLWISSTDYRGEIPVSDEILKRTADTYRRIRNTARFLLANLAGFQPKEHQLAFEKLLPLDQWIVDRAAVLQEEIAQCYQTYNFHQIYQRLHHFCSIDLGSFYLDVIKDRQYTCAKNSIARRSCQTALHHVLEAMVRWMAPILSFTAEEIWQQMPEIENREASVFLTSFYEDLSHLSEDQIMNREFWSQLLLVRSEVSKAIEKQRSEGVLGASLEAEVALYCSPNLEKTLNLLEDELPFVLLTSSATVAPLTENLEKHSDVVDVNDERMRIDIQKTNHQKCVRCWHYKESVGMNDAHPCLCARCVENLNPEGETRKFA